MKMKIDELEQYCCTLYDTRDQLKQYVFSRADEAFAAGDRARDRLITREDVLRRQQEFRKAFFQALGGWPDDDVRTDSRIRAEYGQKVLHNNYETKCEDAIRRTGEDCPLNARTIGMIRESGLTIENIVFEARRGHYVTGNLYLPQVREQRSAAILFLCGHEKEGKHSPYYQRVIRHFVRAGLVVFAIDPPGQGERLSFCGHPERDGEVAWGTQEHQHYGVQCHFLGESVARYFLHDAARALDYLCARPEVDPSRIGVTGNSGGGTQTAMMMVGDDRIAAAAPATFIMNRQQYMHAGGVQDAEQVWPGLTALGYDHEDLLLAFAPKPLLILAAEYDFFPIEATRRTVERSMRYWKLLGEPDLLQLVTDTSTHHYTDRMANEAAAFFVRHLQVKVAQSDVRLEAISPKKLWCSATGQVHRDMKDARTIGDENADRCEQWRHIRAARPQKLARNQAREWLSSQVYSGRRPCDWNPRVVELGKVEGLRVDYRLWWSQEGIMNSAYVFHGVNNGTQKEEHPGKLPLTVAIWQGGTRKLQKHWPWIAQTCGKGRSVLVVNLSGMGPHEPYPIYGKPPYSFFGVLHKLTDDLIWLGDSLAALRTYDVLRCVGAIAHFGEWLSEDIRFHAEGREAIYIQLAALLDDSIRISSEMRPISFKDLITAPPGDENELMSVVWPGILRVLDIGE
ncbi:alpha/beta hydrolase family protein [Paenibacillus senegalensis]|uniref:alpha/beta hydrolase family protein n=1 Tax=Paenibacillus senegalensis TaxID=1465766 RepID=UPI0002896C1F|nr:acetylxylan esterase [Paenibacillus senegalensis]